MAMVQNGDEILPKSFNPLSRAHERYGQIDNRQIGDSKDPT